MEEEEEDWSCVFTFSCQSPMPFVCVTYLAWHRGIFPVQCYTHQISLSQIEIYHLWTVAARDPLSGREALHGNTGNDDVRFPNWAPSQASGCCGCGIVRCDVTKILFYCPWINAAPMRLRLSHDRMVDPEHVLLPTLCLTAR